MDNNTNTLHSPRTQGGMTDMTVGSPARGILRLPCRSYWAIFSNRCTK